MDHNQEDEHTLHDMDAPEGDVLGEYKNGQKVDVYYAWCADEGKRIGGYSGDLTVINNRASNHSYNTGHNTKVYRK